MNTMTLYRIGRWCYLRHIPIVPQIMYRLIFVVCGAVVPMSVEMGEGCYFAYGGLGIVLHERARLGRNVVLAPQVTLGGRSGHEDVPVIEDDCYIGVGAKVLGPIRIGRGAHIGANAVVVKDVPPMAVAAGVPARIISVGTAPKHPVAELAGAL